MASERPPRIPQNQAMAVGSAFDAYVKCFLHRSLFGSNHRDSPQFVFDTLFEKQVEPQNRDYGMKAGAICFSSYKDSGALRELLEILQRADEEPMMEFSKQGIVEDATNSVYRPVGNVMILGKPDLYFRLKGVSITHDWKVNGYVATRPKGPEPGYLKYLQQGHKNHGTAHRDAHPHHENDYVYSLNPNIEMQKPEWGRQLAAYSWICGADVGSEIIVSVDQLCCAPSFPTPVIGVAQHRCQLTPSFQRKTYSEFQDCWDAVQSDHIFRHLSLEDSQARVGALIGQGAAFQGDDPNTNWLKRLREKGGF